MPTTKLPASIPRPKPTNPNIVLAPQVVWIKQNLAVYPSIYPGYEIVGWKDPAKQASDPLKSYINKHKRFDELNVVGRPMELQYIWFILKKGKLSEFKLKCDLDPHWKKKENLPHAPQRDPNNALQWYENFSWDTLYELGQYYDVELEKTVPGRNVTPERLEEIGILDTNTGAFPDHNGVPVPFSEQEDGKGNLVYKRYNIDGNTVYLPYLIYLKRTGIHPEGNPPQFTYDDENPLNCYWDNLILNGKKCTILHPGTQLT